MITKQPTIYKAPTVYKQAGAGGGGIIPVPDGYKQLMWVAPDCDETSARYNSAAYIDLGTNYNYYKWKIDFLDLSKVPLWYANNNIGTSQTPFLEIVNGRTRYLAIRENAGNMEIIYNAQGYYSGPSVQKSCGIETCIIDGVNANISGVIIPNGGGTITKGTGAYSYPFGNGTSIIPIKIGTIKIYDEQDNLVNDWRPVEKLGGGSNRFGYYDVVNDVFKASARAGRYMIPGPEVI